MMQLINKQIKIPKKTNPTVEEIEKYLKVEGLEPLRWSIVKTENNELTIDAVLTKN